MKKIALILVLSFVAAFAQSNNNAIGLYVGAGHGWWGIDLKHLNNEKTFWSIYINDLRFGDETGVGIGAGYHFMHNVIKADASMGRFPLYWGPNVGLGYWSGGENPHKYDGLDIGINVAGGISWFLPTSFKMDLSLELLSPSLGHWHEDREQPDGSWKTKNSPGFGLKGGLGCRLFFHAYFF